MLKTTRLFIIFFLVGLVFAAVPTGQVIEGIKKKFDNTKDFQATIVQTNVDGFGTKTVYKGDIIFVQPNVVRLAYYEKSPQKPSQVAVTDGKYLWIYTVELKQITKQKVDSRNLPLPLMILGGTAQIDEKFRDKNYIRPIERVSLNGKKALNITIKPKNKNMDYKQQTLWVESSTYLPIKAEYKDLSGNVSTVTFNNVKVDRGVDIKSILLEKKTGVKFIDLTK